jgi:P2-related tail formation protein
LITRLGQINTSYTVGNSTGVTATFSGNVQTSQFITADNFITTSDKRLKENINEISSSLDTLSKFNSYTYIKNGHKDAGFIAQEVLEVIPYIIQEGTDGFLTIKDRAIIAYLHSAIIELYHKLKCIEDRLD